MTFGGLSCSSIASFSLEKAVSVIVFAKAAGLVCSRETVGKSKPAVNPERKY